MKLNCFRIDQDKNILSQELKDDEISIPGNGTFWTWFFLLHIVDNREFEFHMKLKAIYNNLSIVQSQEFEATGTKRRVFVPVFERTTRRDKIINCFPYLRCSYRVFQQVVEIFRKINRVDIIHISNTLHVNVKLKFWTNKAHWTWWIISNEDSVIRQSVGAYRNALYTVFIRGIRTHGF